MNLQLVPSLLSLQHLGNSPELQQETVHILKVIFRHFLKSEMENERDTLNTTVESENE